MFAIMRESPMQESNGSTKGGAEMKRRYLATSVILVGAMIVGDQSYRLLQDCIAAGIVTAREIDEAQHDD